MTQHKRNNRLNPIPYFIVCLTVMIAFNMYFTNSILHNIFVGSENFNFIDIVYVQNTGAAFSSFQHSTALLVFISILAILMILIELFRDINKYSIPTFFASAMLVSGIVCNTYERITLGYVRDYISLKFVEFPVFNISDIMINLGVLAIVVLILTKKYKRND